MSNLTQAEFLLTEFLLARIAEDEAQARGDVYEERWLAECEAKRRIVERAQREYADYDDERVQGMVDESGYVCQILATIYADHPDYSDEWRP